jgi:adenosine deaminase
MLALLEKVGGVEKVVSIGMDNAEMPGAEPGLFEKIYQKAKAIGIPHATAHGGEEGHPDPFISDALARLQCERIDHGVQCLKDDAMCQILRDQRIHLTNCPCSNRRLKVYDTFFDGQPDVVRQKLDKGLNVGLNSDDPAYFGGYMNKNLCQACEDSSLTRAELAGCMENAFRASFIPDEQKAAFVKEIVEYTSA